jgi:hypothetical protein
MDILGGSALFADPLAEAASDPKTSPDAALGGVAEPLEGDAEPVDDDGAVPVIEPRLEPVVAGEPVFELAPEADADSCEPELAPNPSPVATLPIAPATALLLGSELNSPVGRFPSRLWLGGNGVVIGTADVMSEPAPG